MELFTVIFESLNYHLDNTVLIVSKFFFFLINQWCHVIDFHFYDAAFGQAILQLFGCILWFLEPETIDTIPHTVASTLAVFQSSLQKETVDLLCTTLLPICLSEYDIINKNL